MDKLEIVLICEIYTCEDEIAFNKWVKNRPATIKIKAFKQTG